MRRPDVAACLLEKLPFLPISGYRKRRSAISENPGTGNADGCSEFVGSADCILHLANSGRMLLAGQEA
jgi:hypothetical protein